MNIYVRGGQNLLYKKPKNNWGHHCKSCYASQSSFARHIIRIFLRLHFAKLKLLDFRFSIRTVREDLFRDHHFLRPNYAFAAFHWPRTFTCFTAVYTPLHCITIHKKNMSQKNRSRGLKEPRFGHLWSTWTHGNIQQYCEWKFYNYH